MPDTKTNVAGGPFAPLRQSVFAVLWAATVLGNVGSFMRDVASSWLVTDLSASPTAVALIQTAATLPIFLLAIPAGVLSDILDRRRFLIFVQVLLACVSGTLLLLSHFGALTVDSALLATPYSRHAAATVHVRITSHSIDRRTNHPTVGAPPS